VASARRLRNNPAPQQSTTPTPAAPASPASVAAASASAAGQSTPAAGPAAVGASDVARPLANPATPCLFGACACSCPSPDCPCPFTIPSSKIVRTEDLVAIPGGFAIERDKRNRDVYKQQQYELGPSADGRARRGLPYQPCVRCRDCSRFDGWCKSHCNDSCPAGGDGRAAGRADGRGGLIVDDARG
ncbi:hypothetical protein MNEG_10418, partial [Monoraphidium neglectum]